MTKAEFVKEIQADATNGGINLNLRQAGALVDAVFDRVDHALRNDGTFTFPGFGTFTVKKYKARRGRNPQTGEALTIPASRKVRFKPAGALQQSIDEAHR